MLRLFETNKVRKQEEISGLWDLKIISGKGNKSDQTQYMVRVPGCYENIPALNQFRGLGEYTKEIEVLEEGNVRLVFHGVSYQTKIFWDNACQKEHYGAFGAFDVIIPNVKAGMHQIRVEADSSWSEDSALHIVNDYYTYGGIIRPVEFSIVPDAYVEWIHVTTDSISSKEWKASIDIKVNFINSISEVMVRCELAKRVFETCICGVEGESKTLHFEGYFEDIIPWEVGKGHLYHISAILKNNGQLIDDLIDRIGFRTTTVSGSDLLINGKKVFPKGFCRHEAHGEFGASIPVETMVNDIYLMLDLGCNSVRTTHYPNDPRFLDLCDEFGILVWEENHARGLVETQMKHKNFREQCKLCNQEMVMQHFNHPSIYVWGILNECASDTEYGRSCYKEQLEQIRSMDASRPLTFASCRFFEDLCLDLVDIVSLNIYPGWYVDEDPGEYLDRLVEWIELAGGQNKPLILSEFGAGGIYGVHDATRAKWTEGGQADILKKQLDGFLKRKQVKGTYIWQFSDCRVPEESMRERPKCQNNKGVVDLYRRPKEAYEVVKSYYHQIPNEYIE